MTALNKQALREAAIHAQSTDDWGCDDNNFHDQATPDVVLALLDALETKEEQRANWFQMAQKLGEDLDAAEKRIAELSASHSKLRDTMATIHNTIRMDGGYTPLAAILNAAKRAYEESASAAGIGVKGE
ncbi:ead/Ea22-like family protein [Salmonella enterica subsp. enterica]|nr:ead/Ea22-like family protein [Salmonella enterica subsp. enterica]EAW2172722.1 ead/Ea22-like family protein [Salmonella enterica subsp. enterica]